MIQVFINECSFHEQLHERSVLVDSFKQFYTLLSLFNQHKVIHELYHHENLFNFYRAMHSEPLSASLNKLKEKSLALAIKGVLFNKLNAKDWQTTRIHSADDLFICMMIRQNVFNLSSLGEESVLDCVCIIFRF